VRAAQKDDTYATVRLDATRVESPRDDRERSTARGEE